MKAPGSPSSPLQMTYFCGGRRPGHRRPLQARRVAGAAAAAQPAVGDRLHHVGGRHVRHDVLQRLVAAGRDVLLDALRVDLAARLADNFHLRSEERVRRVQPGRRRRTAVEGVEDRGGRLRRHLLVEVAGGRRLDERAAAAQAQAADADHLDAVAQLAVGDGLLKRLLDVAASRRPGSRWRCSSGRGRLPGAAFLLAQLVQFSEVHCRAISFRCSTTASGVAWPAVVLS